MKLNSKLTIDEYLDLIEKSWDIRLFEWQKDIIRKIINNSLYVTVPRGNRFSYYYMIAEMYVTMCVEDKNVSKGDSEEGKIL